MAARTQDKKPQPIQPFVLKWAEKAPAELTWSRQSVFSAPVNGLDISMVTEPDHPESTGGDDTNDSTTV